MEIFVLLATAWGSKHGGVNSFNRDFAGGLANALGRKGRVFCAVLDATNEERQDAKLLNVTLLSLNETGNFTLNRIDTVKRLLREDHDVREVDHWIGHDVITGFAALKASEPASHAALIMHMDYNAYLAVKHPGVSSIDEQCRNQAELFRHDSAATFFAVGPLLSKTCRRLSNREPTMLVPGFPQDLPKPGAREGHVTAITLGRLNREDDRLKNGRLAVISYANALAKAKEESYAYKDFCESPSLWVVGLGSDTEVAEVQQLAYERAARHVNIMGSGFENDRERLFEKLVRANLALMLSWHEGFGLSGWEAIGAEVPLILSLNSGLFGLIEALEQGGHGSWRSHVFGVDIKGDLEADQKEVTAKILEAVATMRSRLEKSKALKNEFIKTHGCTWAHTAEAFLKGLPLQGSSARKQQRPALDSTLGDRPIHKKVFSTDAAEKTHAHEETRRRFFSALAKSERAIEKLYEGVKAEPRRSSAEERIAELFTTLLSKPVGHALAILAGVHKAFAGENRIDLLAAKAVRCAVRAYVELVFPDALIEALRPKALADGVFLDLPAQTITGAEIVEAKLQRQPPRFVETMLRDVDGTTRPGRPRGAYAMPMPPTCGPDTLERFGEMVEEWLHDKLAYPGEKLTAEDIRRRLIARKISGERRYYFVVNAPEWGLSDEFKYNVSWYSAYRNALRKCVDELNRSIPQIAFFSLTEKIGDSANEETTILQAVFNLLQIDEECP